MSIEDKIQWLGVRASRKVLDRVRQAGNVSFGISEGLSAARLVLKSILAEIRFWQAEIEQIDQAMVDALNATGLGQFLVSIPGIGPISAANLLGEVGDLTRYEDWRQIRRLAGLNLVENSSGFGRVPYCF